MSEVSIIGDIAISSIGYTTDANFHSLLAGRSGRRPIPASRFDAKYTNSRNSTACVIPFQDFSYRDVIYDMVIDPTRSLLSAVAARVGSIASDRISMCLGTSVGAGLELIEHVTEPRGPTPEGLPGLLNYLRQNVPIAGPISIVSTACTSGAASIVRAAHTLHSRRADLVICGGFDVFTEVTHTGFNSLKVMSRSDCRPYSKDSDGMILGDAVGLLAMCRAADLQGGDAVRFPRLSGWAMGCDNFHETSPDPTGVVPVRLMRTAWMQACRPTISYINGHGTGTLANDQVELRAIDDFAASIDHASAIPVSSCKGHLGHTLGAAGAIEAIVSLACLQNRVAPGNFAHGEAHEHALSTHVLGTDPIDLAEGSILSISLGFGGHVCVLAFSRGQASGHFQNA